MNTDKLYCGVAAVRVLFMDKQYARSFGFVYPNMISFIAYFLTIILILWMIEENKNFKYDEYTFIKYRLSKIGFINKMVIDSIKGSKDIHMFSNRFVYLFFSWKF